MSSETDALKQHFEAESNEELISILRNHDDEEWRPEVFEVVASVLKARGLSPEDIAAMGPEPTVTEVVESAPTITLAHFFSPAEAHGSRMALEEAGIPAAVICTDAFGVTADAMAALQGSPGYRYVRTPHPVAPLGPEGLRQRAAAALPEIVAMVTTGHARAAA